MLVSRAVAAGKSLHSAADGSQINPDRHAAVNYGLVNVGILDEPWF